MASPVFGSIRGQREVLDAPMTPEQKRRKEESDRKRDECAKQNQEQARKDRSLLGTYPTEDDLLAARDHALANEKTLIDQQNQKLKQLKADRKQIGRASCRERGEIWADDGGRQKK